MSPETDILIVGIYTERFTTEIQLAFRHWQVYTCASPFSVYGRKFRHAYYTPEATKHSGWHAVRKVLEESVERHGGKLLPFAEYEEPTSLDFQDWEDAVLASDLRRARYAQDWV